MRLGVKQLDPAPDDEFDEVLVGRLGGDQCAGKAPIAQHRGAVGDLLDFIDIVRNEDDRCAVTHDGAHQRKKLLHPCGGQERCRFIEYQDAGVGAARRLHRLERPHDGHQRPLDLRQVGDARVGVDGEAKSRERFARAPAFLSPVHPPACVIGDRVHAQVFQHRQ